MAKFDNDLATTIGNINIAIQTHTLWEREMLALATGARESGQLLPTSARSTRTCSR